MRDLRKLIAEARGHDAAMSDAPWSCDDYTLEPGIDRGVVRSAGEAADCSKAADALGIAWMRSALRDLIGYAVTLDRIPKHFFHADDGGAQWWVVAVDLTHAQDIIKTQGMDFADFDSLVWHEMTPEEVAKKPRCHVDDDRSVIPLAEANLGEWFCSEW